MFSNHKVTHSALYANRWRQLCQESLWNIQYSSGNAWIQSVCSFSLGLAKQFTLLQWLLFTCCKADYCEWPCESSLGYLIRFDDVSLVCLRWPCILCEFAKCDMYSNMQSVAWVELFGWLQISIKVELQPNLFFDGDRNWGKISNRAVIALKKLTKVLTLPVKN